MLGAGDEAGRGDDRIVPYRHRDTQRHLAVAGVEAEGAVLGTAVPAVPLDLGRLVHDEAQKFKGRLWDVRDARCCQTGLSAGIGFLSIGMNA